MQGYQTFTPTGKWDDDMKTYRYICEGHVGRYDRRIAEHTSRAPAGDGQISQIHANKLKELEGHRGFWQRQHTAASNSMLLEPDGQEADYPEWASCHQNLRAQAIKFSRMIHPDEFTAYAGSR